MEDNQVEADDAVAAQRGQHSLKVSPVNVVVQLESHDDKVADVIRTKGCKEKKVNPYHLSIQWEGIPLLLQRLKLVLIWMTRGASVITKDEDEEGVERDDPEDVFQKDEGAV